VPWEVRYGPFAEAVFSTLPESHWTLLVQAVDHWDDDVAALRRSFPQIPNWRMDDVMASYAVDGGSVGPHYDYYDVFLLQAMGRRRWLVGGAVAPDAAILPGIDLRLLRDFHAESEYLLGPGDALYLPPGYAHWGIADGECITYSIGFRAPADAEVIDGYSAFVADRLGDHQRYRDPLTTPTAVTHPGEITPDVIERLSHIVHRHLTRQSLSRWFGEYATESKDPVDPIDFDDTEAMGLISAGARCVPRLGARFAFIRREHGFDLYADGRRFECPAHANGFVLGICDGEPVASSDVVEFRAIVLDLLRHGSVELR
jgi:50S ribosomal protein L16 3-hydroxylase